jgi:hypothetical protein
VNRNRRTAVVLVVAIAGLSACLLGSAPALAAGGQNPVITDCLEHPSGLTGHYTVEELTHALETMSPETKEYTNCPDVINRARLAAIAHGGTFTPSSSSSSSFLPTPVIIVLVLLILAAVTFGAIAIRRRRQLVTAGADGSDGTPGTPGTAGDRTRDAPGAAGDDPSSRSNGPASDD